MAGSQSLPIILPAGRKVPSAGSGPLQQDFLPSAGPPGPDVLLTAESPAEGGGSPHAEGGRSGANASTSGASAASTATPRDPRSDPASSHRWPAASSAPVT